MIVGIGTDIIEVKRIQEAIDKYGERFLRRIFTAVEIEYCSARKTAPLHYAGRFASKEAAFKALEQGWGGEVSWKDVEVWNEPSGAPRLRLYGKALEIAQSKKVTASHVSISHINDLAAAVVVLEG